MLEREKEWCMQRVEDEQRDGAERLLHAQQEHVEAADQLRTEAEVSCMDAARAGALEARAAVEEVCTWCSKIGGMDASGSR